MLDKFSKILVTGATGFLGGKLIERLSMDMSLKNVTGTGRDLTKGKLITNYGASFSSGDLGNYDFTNSVVKGMDYVIHCSALSTPWGKYSDFYRSNVISTENIINACIENNVKRLIHISTPSIYVNYNDRLDIKESDPLPLVMVNDYAKTKLEAEKLVNKASMQGLETIILRPRAIIGAGDTTIFPRILRAHNEGKLRIIGNGKNISDVTSISNLIDAILLSIEAPNSALGKVYNITNGEHVVFWEFIDMLFNKLNLKLNKQQIPYSVMYSLACVSEAISRINPLKPEPALTCYGVCSLAKSITLNIDAAKNDLGYLPKQSNDETVNEFVNWWKSIN